MAKFKVYYTIELNEIATHIFESNDFEVKLCSHNDEETYVKELAAFQPDAIMCRTEPITAKMMDTCTNLKVIGKQGAGLDNIDMIMPTPRTLPSSTRPPATPTPLPSTP